MQTLLWTVAAVWGGSLLLVFSLLRSELRVPGDFDEPGQGEASGNPAPAGQTEDVEG